VDIIYLGMDGGASTCRVVQVRDEVMAVCECGRVHGVMPGVLSGGVFAAKATAILPFFFFRLFQRRRGCA